MPPSRTPEPLLLVLQRSPEDSFEPDAVAEVPFVPFVAYEARRRLFGWVRLREDRLTDLLNAHDQLRLVDVELETFHDGATQTVDEELVAIADLVAVHASAPRGAESLRRPTRTHPVALQAGSYVIRGHLHAAPGEDPLATFHARPLLVPLTTAAIEYRSAGWGRRLGVGTIIVNRAHVDWVRLVSDEELIDYAFQPTTRERADP